MTIDPSAAARRLPVLTVAALALTVAVVAWPSPSEPLPAGSPDAPGAQPAGPQPVTAAAPSAATGAASDRPAERAPLADLTAAPRPLRPEASPELAAKDPAKKIAKLEKKKDKKQAKIDKTETKIDEVEALLASLEAELLLAQQALLDAQALPAETPEQIKARDKAIKQAEKAIKKLLKKIAKQEKKVGKLDAKVLKTEDQIAEIDEQIDVLVDSLASLPEAGEPGLDGLELPPRMQMVSPDEAPSSLPLDPLVDPTAGFPPEADYFADEQHTFIHDRSMESLQMVNSILCQLGQSGYDELVNLGAYNAQIDRSLCEDGQQTEGGTGGQSEDQTEQLELWVVDSRRTTEDDDHFVGLWIPEGGDDGYDEGPPEGTGGDPEAGPGEEPVEGNIHVLIHIEEEASEANPFGVFDLDFAAVPEGGDEDDTIFWGTLATAEASEGHMGFSFFQEEGDVTDDDSEYGRTQVHANSFLDGTQGVARIKELRHEPAVGGFPGHDEDVEYLLAYDEEHLLRHEVGGEEVCLSRVDFDTSVWRYNLYHASGEQAGERVTLQSGFGITTAEGEFGWAGYHGLWVPDHVDLSDGDVVFGHTYGPPTGDPPPSYEVFEAPGLLFEYRRAELALAELDGETFEWWDPGVPMGPPPALYLVQYDHLSGEFIAIEELQGPDWVPLDPLDQFAIDRFEHPWLGLWSFSLGGHVEHLDGEDTVTYFTEQVVDASHPLLAEGDVSFFGLVDCLDADILGTDAQLGQVFLPDPVTLLDAHEYRFAADTMALELVTPGVGGGFSTVGLADGESYTGGPFDWGMRSGPMVTSLDGLVDPWDVYDVEVTYVYETGPNPWNRYRTLRELGGDLVAFDPPIQFTYVHSQANDRNGDATHDGKTFQLEFNGPGDLWGIPHDGFDTDGDGFEDRWYPRFSLADGVLLGPEGDEYVVKALEMEQRLQEHPAGCNALTTGPVASLPLPEGDTYAFPDIGDKPEVTDPPLVIAGEVQGGDDE